MTHLTSKERNLYTQTFLDADINGDGYLSKVELGLFCTKLGYRLSNHALNVLFNTMDEDRNGKVTLDEFLKVIPTATSPQERQSAELRRVFKQLDINKDGVLSIEELQQGLSRGGLPLQREEVEQLFAQGDKNGDGELDYDEFISLVDKMKRK